MTEGPAEKLQSAAKAISTAVVVMRLEEATLRAFLEECRDMNNFGHILDPTLFRNSERRAVSAILEPLFKAAIAFIGAYDAHIASAEIALAKVRTP